MIGYIAGTTTDVSYLFNYDISTAILDLWGDLVVINTVVTYDIVIQTYDAASIPSAELWIETITVDWTAAPTCDTPVYVLDAAVTVTSFAHDPMLATDTVV